MGTNKDAHSMTIWDHLGELRKRVIIILLTVMVAAVICFAYVDDILEFLLKPAPNLQLIFTTPPEALVAQVRLALQAALIVTATKSNSGFTLCCAGALEETEKEELFSPFLAMNAVLFRSGF